MKRLFNPANLVWVVLVLASGLSYSIAEAYPGQTLGAWLVAALFTLAAVKGWLVIDVFMGLRNAPVFWRGIMLAWLLVICTLLTLIYVLL